MKLNEIVEKIKNKTAQTHEVMAWRSSKNFSLWHATPVLRTPELFEALCAIVDQEVNKEKINEKNPLGDCPAHIAVWAENLEVLKHIMTYSSNLDFYDHLGRNPAMLAIHTKNKKIIDYVLSHTDNINCQDKNGRNLLHYAQTFSDTSLFKKLQKMGVSLVTDNMGKIPSIPEQNIEDSIAEFVKKPIAI